MRRQSNSKAKSDVPANPELVFGLVGPIGVDLDAVINSLEENLKSVGYKVEIIKITDIMIDTSIEIDIDETSYFGKYKSLISYANAVRENHSNASTLAGLAISKIRQLRKSIVGSADKPSFNTAYIIRQFKRPEEISLLRKVYGRKFIQVSVFSGEKERKEYLVNKIKNFDNSTKDNTTCETQALELIKIDFLEKEKSDFGQKISDVFHLGDVFIEGNSPSAIEKTTSRFILAFFGDNGISPTRAEYGMYISAAASLRSIDLSRQVGAAIFSSKGDIISMGCNEVPKAFGGTYWEDEEYVAFRDFEKGKDPNHQRKVNIFYDLIERMSEAKFLANRFSNKGVQSIIDELLTHQTVKESQIMDIIEFGRIIHAEMSALVDAARSGAQTSGGILYCTTFPCHLCAKHIVAAGIQKVVFLEPYPKSYAHDLHADSITFDREKADAKVLFEPFIGISPRRYRDIFEKNKRKDGNGIAKKWYESSPVPRVEDKSDSYLDQEKFAIAEAFNLGAGANRKRRSRGKNIVGKD